MACFLSSQSIVCNILKKQVTLVLPLLVIVPSIPQVGVHIVPEQHPTP